jgi:hypothetical protein
MKRVGILVGHYGKGTGASLGERDEWRLCWRDAMALSVELARDRKVEPVFIAIDREAHPWDLIPDTLALRLRNIRIRADWAIREKVDAAVEFHLNRSTLNDLRITKATGNEVWIRRAPGPKTQRLGALLVEEFNRELGNRDRGLKTKSFNVLSRLHNANIPAAILEPAFLVEDIVELKPWRAKYVGAVKAALYRFFNL